LRFSRIVGSKVGAKSLAYNSFWGTYPLTQETFPTFQESFLTSRVSSLLAVFRRIISTHFCAMDASSAAQILYMRGLPQKEIARLLKVSERTISNYAIDGEWKQKRKEENTFKETAAERVRQLINHNLHVLTLISDKQREDLDKNLSIDELQKRLISKGEADGLAKLYAQIKGKEAEWDVLVTNIHEFMEFLEREDLKLAQKLLPFSNEFLNIKRKQS
jgi:predicted transcriptional regulator